MPGKTALVVLDMDGVLVDVSRSYREVVRLSVAAYLRAVLGADSLPGDIITLADVDFIKKAGGFGNDWDLTCEIIDLLLRRYFDALNGSLAGPGSAADEAARCGEDGKKLALVRAMAKNFDTRALVAGPRVKPVRALFADDARERSAEEGLRTGARGDGASGRGGAVSGGAPPVRPKSPFLFDEGDVGSGNLVKRIFQELYLGPELFEEVYGARALFDLRAVDRESPEPETAGAGAARRGRAFIDRERLIPSTAHLVELASLGGLAIATGRPAVEARYPLRKFGIAHLFKALVSEDDVVEAEKARGRPLRKPDPFSVALAIERSGAAPAGNPASGRRLTPEGGPVFYVGDMPGDMTAALGAGARPLGFVDERGGEWHENAGHERARHREMLLAAGAEAVFGSYDEIVKYVRNAV
jgi:phosphoglycolate phosphatase-like HAD superfamily hydrolase